MPRSRTYSTPSNSRTSLAGEATATLPSGGVVAPGQPALGDLGADAGRGEEGRDPAAAGAQPLGQGALRGQLDLQLAGQVLAGELLVLADVEPVTRAMRPAASRMPRPPPSTPQLFDTTRRSAAPCS
jgi:hypothetical protein